jgi:hypothetical protein
MEHIKNIIKVLVIILLLSFLQEMCMVECTMFWLTTGNIYNNGPVNYNGAKKFLCSYDVAS